MYKKNCAKQLLGKIFVDVTFMLFFFFHKVDLTLIKSKAFMLDFINYFVVKVMIGLAGSYLGKLAR